MAGVHVKEAPGYSGWTHLRDRSWKTMNRSEMEQMRVAIEADKAECPLCTEGDIVPHMTGYVNDHAAYTYHCRSLSRWYNPETRKMEGRAHCTCDSCF